MICISHVEVSIALYSPLDDIQGSDELLTGVNDSPTSNLDAFILGGTSRLCDDFS